MCDQDWKRFVLSFGKHKGQTMLQAYVNDFDYVWWLAKNIIGNDETKRAAEAAVEHKNKVDPYATTDL